MNTRTAVSSAVIPIGTDGRYAMLELDPEFSVKSQMDVPTANKRWAKEAEVDAFLLECKKGSLSLPSSVECFLFYVSPGRFAVRFPDSNEEIRSVSDDCCPGNRAFILLI